MSKNSSLWGCKLAGDGQDFACSGCCEPNRREKTNLEFDSGRKNPSARMGLRACGVHNRSGVVPRPLPKGTAGELFTTTNAPDPLDRFADRAPLKARSCLQSQPVGKGRRKMNESRCRTGKPTEAHNWVRWTKTSVRGCSPSHTSRSAFGPWGEGGYALTVPFPDSGNLALSTSCVRV